VRLTIVGCAGSYPGPDSSASCYLLEDEHEGRTWRILLDLGNGALGQLQRYVDPFDVDAVFLSHLHADHCLDMCGYYVLRKYHPEGPARQIPVWGPVGTAERLANAYDLPLDPGMSEEFDFREHGDPVTVGPFRVETREVVHPIPAYALRITAGGRTLVYTGDTGPCAAVEEIAVGADLLLAEASFEEGRPNPPDLHLTGAECGHIAAGAGVGGLLLTHIPPWHDPQVVMEEARGVYSGPLGVANPGARYEI
jgi:ribonuclease BN (tRNA processing enzyme)